MQRRSGRGDVGRLGEDQLRTLAGFTRSCRSECADGLRGLGEIADVETLRLADGIACALAYLARLPPAMMDAVLAPFAVDCRLRWRRRPIPIVCAGGERLSDAKRPRWILDPAPAGHSEFSAALKVCPRAMPLGTAGSGTARNQSRSRASTRRDRMRPFPRCRIRQFRGGQLAQGHRQLWCEREPGLRRSTGARASPPVPAFLPSSAAVTAGRRCGRAPPATNRHSINLHCVPIPMATSLQRCQRPQTVLLAACAPQSVTGTEIAEAGQSMSCRAQARLPAPDPTALPSNAL
jgi:hypothetical protein